MNTFTLFMILKADDVGLMFTLLLFACIGGIITLWIRHAVLCDCYSRDEDEIKQNLLWIKQLFIAGIACIIVGTALPSTKQLAALYALPKIQKAYKENNNINQIPDKILQLANKKLDEAIKGN